MGFVLRGVSLRTTRAKKCFIFSFGLCVAQTKPPRVAKHPSARGQTKSESCVLHAAVRGRRLPIYSSLARALRGGHRQGGMEEGCMVANPVCALWCPKACAQTPSLSDESARQ